MTSTYDKIKQHLDMMHSVEERIWTVIPTIPPDVVPEHELYFFVDEMLQILPKLVTMRGNVVFLEKLPERVALDTAMMGTHLQKLPDVREIDGKIAGYAIVETEMKVTEKRYLVRISFVYDEIV